MTIIIVDSAYRSTQGRKPSRPAFLYDFHNDAAAGTSVTDRFGNARALSLAGTLGTSWSANRGFWTPNGTDQHAITSSGTGEDYAAQTVMADALLTPGSALFVAWRLGWTGTKTSTTEAVMCLGRNHATSAMLQVGHNAGGSIEMQVRGFGASTQTSPSFGSASLYNNATTYSCALHIEATATGVSALAWLDGVSVGSLQDVSWLDNAGAVPAASVFAMPDGITVGAKRGGSSSGSPTWLQRVGAETTGTTILANLLALNMAQANVADAAALALELHQYPRHVGEILAGM